LPWQQLWSTTRSQCRFPCSVVDHWNLWYTTELC